MTSLLRLLRLDGASWVRVEATSFPLAAAAALGASFLAAWNRFGGLVIDAPRAFVRFGLIGVYGWLGLAVLIWLVAMMAPTSGRRSTLLETVTVVGLSHRPPIVFGMVLFAAAGLFRMQGPGLVAAALIFGLWFPAVLVVATRALFRVGLMWAVTLVVVPYTIWLALVGRYQLDQVQHLL